MTENIRFAGKNSFSFFTGIVEDRFDPLSLGRVRVRIYGIHSDEKNQIATPDLPWAQVLMPTTSPSLSGMGLSPHGLVEGSTVMGFFRDGSMMQDPVVLGSLFGIPNKYYKQDERGEGIERSASRGFNDPRVSGKYSGDDAPNPDHIQRTFGLSLTLDDSPRRPDSVEMKVDGTGSKINQPDKGINYPKEDYYDQSDVNFIAQNDISQYPNDRILQHEGSIVKEPSRSGQVNSTYPFNHVYESESGHVFEVDDSPAAERIHLYHRSGTRLEVLPDGSRVTKIANDDYEIVVKDKKLLVFGQVDIEVNRDKYQLTVGDEINIKATGDINITSTGTCNIVSGGEVDIKGGTVKLNSL